MKREKVGSLSPCILSHPPSNRDRRALCLSPHWTPHHSGRSSSATMTRLALDELKASVASDLSSWLPGRRDSSPSVCRLFPSSRPSSSSSSPFPHACVSSSPSSEKNTTFSFCSSSFLPLSPPRSSRDDRCGDFSSTFFSSKRLSLSPIASSRPRHFFLSLFSVSFLVILLLSIISYKIHQPSFFFCFATLLSSSSPPPLPHASSSGRTRNKSLERPPLRRLDAGGGEQLPPSSLSVSPSTQGSSSSTSPPQSSLTTSSSSSSPPPVASSSFSSSSSSSPTSSPTATSPSSSPRHSTAGTSSGATSTEGQLAWGGEQKTGAEEEGRGSLARPAVLSDGNITQHLLQSTAQAIRNRTVSEGGPPPRRPSPAPGGTEGLDPMSSRLAGRRFSSQIDSKKHDLVRERGSSGWLLAEHVCQSASREPRVKEVSLGAGTTGVVEQIPDVRRRSHWLSVQLDEEHLPGLDAPPLLQQSLEPDLSVLVTPYKSVLQASNLQIFYQKPQRAAGVEADQECAWLRDLTSTGPVLARLSKGELQALRRQVGLSKVFVLITCDVPCAPHITVAWQDPTQVTGVVLKCESSEGSETGGEGDEEEEVVCPVVSGETLPGVPVHYTFRCTDACQKALEAVDRPNLQVVVSPALHQPPPPFSSSSSPSSSTPASSSFSSSPSSSLAPSFSPRYQRLEVLAAWDCMPETLDASEARAGSDDWDDEEEKDFDVDDDETEEDSSVSVVSPGANDPLSSSSFSLRGNSPSVVQKKDHEGESGEESGGSERSRENAIRNSGGRGGGGGGEREKEKRASCSSLSAVAGASGVSYLSVDLDEVHVGDEEANSQVLHIVVVGRSLLPQRFNLSLELPRSVTEIALDKPLKVVLPKGALRFYKFFVPDTEWDVAKSCTSAARGTKVEYAPIEVAATASSGGVPSLAVAHADLEPHPDPATSRKEQVYTWRSHDTTPEAEGRGLMVPTSVVTLGSDALRAQKPYGWFVIGVQASSDRAWSLVTLSVTLKGAAFHARGWAEVSEGLGLAVRYIPFSEYCQDTFFTFRTGPSPDESLVLLVQMQQGDMPKEFCAVPCAPADSLFHSCPSMPLDSDAPCPTELVTRPAPEIRVVKALLPARLLQRNYIYGVRARLASWQEITFVVALWRPTALDAFVQSVQMVNGVPFRGAMYPVGAGKETKIQLVLTVDKNTLARPRTTSSSKPQNRFYRFSLSIVASAPGISGHLLIPIKKHKHTESPAKPTPPPGRTSSTTTATGSNSRRLTHRRIPLRLQGDSPARIFSFAEDFPVEKVLQEDEGIGDWRLVLRSQLKEGVFIDVTMDFGLADDGESGSNKTAEGGEQAGGGGEEDAGERFLRGGTVIHLMDGAVYTGVIHRPHGTSGQDQKTGADRFYFYFSVDYAILDARREGDSHAVPPQLRCSVSSFSRSGRKARLFANVLTKSNASHYKPPDPQDPATVTWPKGGKEGSFPSIQELEVPLGDDNHIPVGTASAAYVLLVEGAPSVPPVTPATAVESKEKKAENKAAEGKENQETSLKEKQVEEAEEIPFTIQCSGTGSVTPLTSEMPLTRSIRADASHYYSFATPVHDKDIVISLTTGAVGDADLYVSTERTVSSTRGNFMWCSEDFGSDWVFISAMSSLMRRVCNAEVTRTRGACVFFILVKASEDAQYTLEVRQEVGGYELLLPDGKPVKDFIRRGHTRTFAYGDASPEQDLRISVTGEHDVAVYAALGTPEILSDLTPLQLGTAQWWSATYVGRSIDIKGSDLRRRQAASRCEFRKSSSPSSAVLPKGHSKAVQLEKTGPASCVLRIDVASHQDQAFSLALSSRPTNSVITNLIVDSAPNVGVLWEKSDVKYEMVLDDFIIENDLDAELRLAVSSFDCHATLTVRWPDGHLRAFEWPRSGEVVIGRSLHPWVPGAFVFMIHDPSISGANTCFYVFHAHVATTLHEPRQVFALETNVPMKASVTSHRPTYFVWTMPYGLAADDQFFLLRVTPFVHMVDVYAQPLHKNRGFPKRPDPGQPLPSSARHLVQETPESPTLTLRVGHMWRQVPGVEWLPACEPSDLATAGKDDDKTGTDTEDIFHPLDTCQLLISVFDHQVVTEDARESREVGFGIQVTSGLAEAVEICSFGQTVSLVKEDFAGVHKTKALLLYQDNPGAEVHLRVASQDPYLMEKMTASVFHNATRLHEELERPGGCQLGTRGKFCWLADVKQDWQGGSVFALVIKPEERVTEHRDFLYVTLYLNKTYASEFQPVVEFTATQSSLYIPLKNNIDSDTYFVTRDKPAFFSFESMESTGQLILTLDPDRDPPSKSEDHHVAYRERIQLPLQKTRLFVQSCNTETFVRALWNPLLAPSPMLHSDVGYINERDQIVAIVDNNWETMANPICVYRIGVYTTSDGPLYFRLTAALIHRSVPMAVAIGSTVFAHVSKKPQVLKRRGGTVHQSLAVGDKFTFRLWKNPNFDGPLVATFEVCSGTAALRWNDRLSNIVGSTVRSGIFLGTMQLISRRTDSATLQQQGRVYKVVKAKSASFLGVSGELPDERKAEGYIRQANSTFSITMNNLGDMLCLGADSEDVSAEISAAPWYEQLRHAFTGSRWNLKVSWKPLVAFPAKTALSEDGKWACSRTALRERGKRVVPEHVQYEVFVAAANATKANWLASCGLYMDTEYYRTTSKYVIDMGKTSFSLSLDARRPHAYKVAVLAKHIPRVFKQGTQPFTYRYVEVELASTEALFSLGFTYLLLFALAIALMFACRRNFLARLKSMAEFLLGARTPAYFCRPSQRGGYRGIELCRSAQGYMPPPSTLGCSSMKSTDGVDSFSDDPFNIRDERYTISPLPQGLEPWAARDHT